MCLACEIFALVKWHAMCLVKWHAMCLACESIALGNLACGRRRQVRCSGTSARSLRRCMGQGKRSRFFQSAPSRTVIARKCFQSTPDRTARRSLLSLRVQLAAAGRANCARATPSRSLGFSGMSSSLRAGSSGRLVTRGPVACFAACHRVAKVSAVVRSRHARCAGGLSQGGAGPCAGLYGSVGSSPLLRGPAARAAAAACVAKVQWDDQQPARVRPQQARAARASGLP